MQSRLIFYLLLLLATAAMAQQSAPRLLQANSGELGASFEYWSSGDDKVSEFVLPLVVRYSASDYLSFTLLNQPTLAKLSRPAGDFSLNGLTDTRLGASYLFAGETMLATAGVNLPTGKTELDEEGLAVAQIIPLHSLGLRTTYFGGGLDLSAGLSAAFPMNDWVFGVGAGFVHTGTFKPVQNSDDYNPGDEISLTVGFDRSFDEESKLLADFTYTLYTTDTFQGTDYFKSAPRLLFEARYYFPLQNFDMAVMVRDRIKGKNETLQIDPDTDIAKLREESANTHGNELDIIAQGGYALSERTSVEGLLQVKIYSANELEANGATIFSIGGGWRRQLSSILNLDLGAKFSFGSLKSQGKSTGITGFELRGGIVYQF